MQDVELDECERIDGGYWAYHLIGHAIVEAFCHATDFSVSASISIGDAKLSVSVSC